MLLGPFPNKVHVCMMDFHVARTNAVIKKLWQIKLGRTNFFDIKLKSLLLSDEKKNKIKKVKIMGIL